MIQTWRARRDAGFSDTVGGRLLIPAIHCQ